MYNSLSNLFKKPSVQDRIAFIFIKELLKIIILEESINVDANRNKFYYFNIPKEISKNLDQYNIEFRFYDVNSKYDVMITLPKKFTSNKDYRCIYNIIHKNEYLDYTNDESVYLRYNNKFHEFEQIFINQN